MSSIPAVQWFARADRTLGSRPSALEVAVEVSGAQATGAADSRQLFTEETKTTLVFEDGAVVRLSAAVVVGQLLFLRHSESQKEIVTRVLRQRSFGTAVAYVELEFTEVAPDFWGQDISASESGAEVAGGGAVKEAAVEAAAEVAEIIEQHVPHVPHATPVAADAQEVARLREELAGLRVQMSSMLESKAASRGVDAGSAAAGVMEADEASGGGCGTSVATKMLASRLKKTEDGDGQESSSEKATNAAAAEVEALPRGRVKVSAGLIAALLILGLVAASAYCESFLADWYAKRNLNLAGAGAVSSVADSGKEWTAAPAGSKTPNVSAATAGGPPGSAGNAPQDGPQRVAGNRALEGAAAASTAPSGGDAVSTAQAEEPEQAGAKAAAEKTSRSDRAENDGNHLAAVLRNTSNGPVAATVSAAAEEVYEAPVLVKAVNAVPPPDAIRGFVTGDVKFDALIDTKGNVSSAKVISGPEALRAAALDALRHYQYKPATKNGQSVAARVAVTVKFWYEP